MEQETNGSMPEATPVASAPTEQITAPESSPEPAPAAEPTAASPIEGQPAEASVQPSAADKPAAPQETAAQRRAREIREKTAGMLALADKIDPPTAQAPAPQAPAAPVATPALSTTPDPVDYFDEETGEIDPEKLAAYTSREAARQVEAALAARDAQTAQKAGQDAIKAQLNKYADTVASDAEYLAKNVPELNPESPEYDKALDDQIEEDYKRMTQDSNGNIVRIDLSLKEYAERQAALARRYKTQAAAVQPNLDAASGLDSAIAPGGSPLPGGKSVDDMDAKEYEAYLIKNGTKVVRA